ncbi:MAG: phosphoribosylanthranilate isomerase [Bryobacteraceae bacterium]
MIVKVCGITRREDAEVAVDAGASALGFIFYPKSPRHVTPDAAAQLGEGLKIWKVGVFVDETAASVEAVMRSAKLDVAQIYGGETPSGVRVWRAYRLPLAEGAPAIDPSGCEAVLLDSQKNGESFDWNAVRSTIAGDGKIIVAGGLDASNVAEAIRVAKPWGVDASSKFETAPGIKDHEKVRAFVKAALEAGKAASR